MQVNLNKSAEVKRVEGPAFPALNDPANLLIAPHDQNLRFELRLT